jgi:hypothetical protein
VVADRHDLNLADASFLPWVSAMSLALAHIVDRVVEGL